MDINITGATIKDIKEAAKLIKEAISGEAVFVDHPWGRDKQHTVSFLITAGDREKAIIKLFDAIKDHHATGDLYKTIKKIETDTLIIGR